MPANKVALLQSSAVSLLEEMRGAASAQPQQQPGAASPPPPSPAFSTAYAIPRRVLAPPGDLRSASLPARLPKTPELTQCASLHEG